MIIRGLSCKFEGLGCQRLHGHVSKTQHALSLFNVFLHCSLNHERPNPMYRCFKQKYKRCLDPNDDMISCFSTGHFSYGSAVQVGKDILVNHYQCWVAKNKLEFKPLFDNIHLMDKIKEGETNAILIQKSLDKQKLIMKQAWSKALGELNTDQRGGYVRKHLHRFILYGKAESFLNRSSIRAVSPVKGKSPFISTIESKSCYLTAFMTIYPNLFLFRRRFDFAPDPNHFLTVFFPRYRYSLENILRCNHL
jgi:hypothetical protein